MRYNACNKHLNIVGLRQIIIAACSQCRYNIIVFAECGQEQYRNIVFCLYLTAKRYSVTVREHYIKYHKIDIVIRQHITALRRICRLKNAVILHRKTRTVYLHYMRIVLYKQNRTHFASSFPHGTVKRNTAPFSLLSAVISPPVDSIISRQI